MSLREQFDQWVKDRRPDKYPAEWEAFQAGHAAGLEAGAKVADANWHYETAAAIRAMKP